MLVVDPAGVRFGATELGGVVRVAVDRKATKQVVEHDDLGPWVAFADTAEVRATVRVVRRVEADELDGVSVGTRATLTVLTGANASDAGVRELSATCVLMSVEHDLRAGGSGALQTLVFVAVSADGSVDPVTVTGVGV